MIDLYSKERKNKISLETSAQLQDMIRSTTMNQIDWVYQIAVEDEKIFNLEGSVFPNIEYVELNFVDEANVLVDNEVHIYLLYVNRLICKTNDNICVGAHPVGDLTDIRRY